MDIILVFLVHKWRLTCRLLVAPEIHTPPSCWHQKNSPHLRCKPTNKQTLRSAALEMRVRLLSSADRLPRLECERWSLGCLSQRLLCNRARGHWARDTRYGSQRRCYLFTHLRGTVLWKGLSISFLTLGFKGKCGHHWSVGDDKYSSPSVTCPIPTTVAEKSRWLELQSKPQTSTTPSSVVTLPSSSCPWSRTSNLEQAVPAAFLSWRLSKELVCDFMPNGADSDNDFWWVTTSDSHLAPKLFSTVF